jgi:predicted nucleic acid-binding protein
VNRPRVVVDTSVLVNFLTGGTAENDDPEWFDHSKWIFEAHQDEVHRVAVPVIVIAELAGCGTIRGSHLDRQTRHQRIARVRKWIAEGGFLPIEISLTLAEEAAELAITHQLTGADACIVAAAARHECGVVYTWDNGLLKLGDQVAGVQIRKPERVLPRQGELEFEDTPASSPQEHPMTFQVVMIDQPPASE